MANFDDDFMVATYTKYILDFKRPSGTSRGVLTQKETWFILLKQGEKLGIGECGLLRGLSCDDVPHYEEKLRWTCKNIGLGLDRLWEELREFPSIQFGLEQALLSLEAEDSHELFPSLFSKGNDTIPINGLVWMGDTEFMLSQVAEKLEQGFRCIKMKIGAIDFTSELRILEAIRNNYSQETIELRVDANGAFSPTEALSRLKTLAQFGLHSIEQPIKQGQWSQMARLCAETPLPIALDEELIGIHSPDQKRRVLQRIQPQFIILKPSLLGGFKGANEWIHAAEQMGVAWWVTSALESNVGLNAIAQWTYTLQTKMPQGLGTGSLYTNNFDSPLTVKKGYIYIDNNKTWQPHLIESLCT